MRHNMSTAWKLGRKPTVCVIGAGFSGLTCAERLGRHGMDVTIVEARDRVGGRVHQMNTVGHWTDMGANWIHGAHVNPIRDLARKVGAVTLSLDDSTVMYGEDGKTLPVEQVEKLEGVTWAIIEDAFKHSHSNADIPADKSLYDFVLEEVKKQDLSKHEQQIVLHMSEMWGGYIGTPFNRQSLKYLLLESSLEGENAFIASTYRDILKYIERQALKQASIYPGTEVTSISTKPTAQGTKVQIACRVSEHRKQNMPTLQLSSSYDAVVVTVPFGCLKEQQIHFTPALPKKLSHAIQSITYGNLEKVYVRFPRAYWLTTEHPHPFFTHFLHPEFTAQNPKHWDIGLVSLAASPEHDEDASHPTLLFYIYGPCGTHVTNLITDLQQSDPEYTKRLTEFFEPYYSRLPNYDPQNPDCKPAAVLATDWQHDRLAGHGSYTNWQIDDNDKYSLPPKMPLDDAIKMLREGVPEQNIFFAGEHTSPFAALGTVTGAYLSGEAVAERLIRLYSVQGEAEAAKMEEGAVFHPQVEKTLLPHEVQVGKGMQGDVATFAAGPAAE